MEEKRKKKAVTETEEITVSSENIKSARTKGLTDNEEYVMRMLYGISEGKDIRLEKKGQNNPEVKARLLLLEKALFEELKTRSKKPPLSSQSIKRKIIDNLKKS